jgi:hypothetical protein
MFDIEMLPADEGDALWIEYSNESGFVHRILVDCGRKPAYQEVRSRLGPALPGVETMSFDLIILTHVDDDHIYGAVPLLGDPVLRADQVLDVWFNGWHHLNGDRLPPPDALGALKGEYFSALLLDRRLPWNQAFDRLPVVVPDDGPLPSVELAEGMKLTLLSPTPSCLSRMRDEWQRQLTDKRPGERGYVEPGDTEGALLALAGTSGMQPDALGKSWLAEWDADEMERYAGSPFSEDTAPANGSSIAVLAEYAGKAVLLAADAYPSVLIASLKRLKRERNLKGPFPLDAFKVPHHGSENNVSAELVSAVSCRRWLISTNGARHSHPHPSAIARIIAGSTKPTIYFNFLTRESQVWEPTEMQRRHNYVAVYGQNGKLKISV